MNLLSVGTGIFSVVAPATRFLFNFFIFTTYGASLLLCTVVLYPLAAEAYALFWLMAEINYSVLGKELQHIITNIQIFTGIFMLFIIAFNLLQYLVNPDSSHQKNSKSLIMKIVVVLVLLVSSSFIFNMLDDLQHAIIGAGSDHLIEKIITGNENFEKGNTVYEASLKEGKFISYSVFFSMYKNKNAIISNEKFISGELPLLLVMVDYYQATKGIFPTISLIPGITIISILRAIGKGQFLITDAIDYTFPVFTDTVGVFLIVMFLKFAIDIGVRNITLLFLRMIFPIMALSYLLPNKKDDYFIKYVTYYLSVYVSYFIKIAIVYILFFMITWMLNQISNLSTSSELFAGLGIENYGLIKALLLIAFLVAVFMFYLKGLPLIGEKVFGIKPSNKNTFSTAAGLLGGVVGFAVGGIAGAVKGGKAGGFGTAIKGLASGAGKAASAGMNAGKSAASGKIGQAINSMSSGIKATRTAINDNASKTPRKLATSEADKAVQSYNEANAKAQELDAIANSSGATEADRIRANNAKAVADKAKQNALDKTAKAQKLDKNYKNSLVTESRREQSQEVRTIRRNVSDEVNDAFRQGREADRAANREVTESRREQSQEIRTIRRNVSDEVNDAFRQGREADRAANREETESRSEQSQEIRTIRRSVSDEVEDAFRQGREADRAANYDNQERIIKTSTPTPNDIPATNEERPSAAKKENVEKLDSRVRKEKIENLRSSLNKKRVADRTREIVAEDGESPEKAYNQAEDEELETLSKRIDELISEGLSEADAIEKAKKEYEEERI